MMRERGIKARFVRGGSTQYLVDMLEEGLTDYILDGQTFDLEGVRSMRENPGHVNTSPFTSYNWHGKGNFASDARCGGAGRHRGGRELQRQRRDPQRRPPAARHRRLA